MTDEVRREFAKKIGELQDLNVQQHNTTQEIMQLLEKLAIVLDGGVTHV
jgi:hypothetical protein